MSQPVLSAKVFLDKCEFISQDDDTVYIDEDALVNCLEEYGDYRALVASNQSGITYTDNFIEDDAEPKDD